MASSASATTVDLAEDHPEEEVRQALVHGQLRLHYQPIVPLATGVVTGAEALLRWQHPSGSLLLPDEFLPSVRQSQLMPDLTRWVLLTACTEAARWGDCAVSVNVSASDVVRADLVTDVRRTLQTTGLPGERLTIELTEHAVVQDIAAAADVLLRLRDLGVNVSLDDFGTGYSSLFYLRELPITEVKIDRVFVTHLDTNDDDAAIVESVVRLAAAVGVTAVAEGVERTSQAAALRGMGCAKAQGYLWGAARPFLELADRPQPVPAADEEVVTRVPRPSRPWESIIALQRIDEMLGQGASLHTIAAALNRSGITTAKGTRWTAAAVARAVTHR